MQNSFHLSHDFIRIQTKNLRVHSCGNDRNVVKLADIVKAGNRKLRSISNLSVNGFINQRNHVTCKIKSMGRNLIMASCVAL